jgi:hypothetical protein
MIRLGKYAMTQFGIYMAHSGYALKTAMGAHTGRLQIEILLIAGLFRLLAKFLGWQLFSLLLRIPNSSVRKIENFSTELKLL